jgi:hypothetical protein
MDGEEAVAAGHGIETDLREVDGSNRLALQQERNQSGVSEWDRIIINKQAN